MIIRLGIIILLISFIVDFKGYERIHNPYRSNIIKKMQEEVVDTISAFDNIVEFVIQREGHRYVNDKSINEESKMGITNHAYKDYYGKVNKYSIINLKKDQAIAIYRELFWVRNSLDSVVDKGYPSTAVALMDSEVNLGPYRANIMFQRSLSMPRKYQNGRIDSTTLSYLSESDIPDSVLYKGIIRQRRSFYKRLIEKDTVYIKYGDGWNNRLDSIVKFVEEL